MKLYSIFALIAIATAHAAAPTPPPTPKQARGTVNVSNLHIRATPRGRIITTAHKNEVFQIAPHTGENWIAVVNLRTGPGYAAARFINAGIPAFSE